MVDDTATPNSAQSPVALDLDALAPKAAQISFKGKTIEVRALDLPDYAAFIELYNILSSLKADESTRRYYYPRTERGEADASSVTSGIQSFDRSKLSKR